MKFKYFFALILISTIVFSLGTVMASENVNATSSDDTYLSIDDAGDVQLSAEDDLDDELENQNDDLIKEGSSDDEVDLAVYMELGDTTSQTHGVGEITFDVPLIITAKASNGTAKDAKVYITIPDEFEYVSSDSNIGTYASESGIWSIGDLSSNVDATLTVFTKISTKGTFKISVNATTDSKDIDLSNNDLECNIQVSSKIASNYTRTSADQNGAQHSSHQGSSTGGGAIDRPDRPQHDGAQPQKGDDGGSSDNGGGSGSGAGSGSGSNGGSSDNGGDSGPSPNGGASNAGANSGSSSNGVEGSNSKSEGAISSNSRVNGIKQVNPNVLAEVARPVSDTINNILNPNSNDKDSAESPSVVKAINVYDYTQVPIVIFGLFLVLLFGMVAYDKVKT